MGTIINVCGIVAGGLIGLVAGRFLTERFQSIVNVAMALSVIALSLSGIVAKMLVITESGIDTQGTYMIIFSLTLGALAGEGLDIDRRLVQFGEWLKQKTGNSRDQAFTEGFVNASLTVCVGAMAVVGAIMDGISGDYSILLTKAILDLVIILVMTAAHGKGCIFSAIPVGLFQGVITLLARLISPLMSPAALDNLSLVGSILILCVGINLLFDGKFRIKVANLLPSLVFAVAAAFIF